MGLRRESFPQGAKGNNFKGLRGESFPQGTEDDYCEGLRGVLDPLGRTTTLSRQLAPFGPFMSWYLSVRTGNSVPGGDPGSSTM